MKKALTLFLLCLSAVLFLTACSAESTRPSETSGPVEEIDLWSGVDGDTRTITFRAYADESLQVLFSKSGEIQVDSIMNQFTPVSDFGEAYAEMDAEMAVYATFYGTYQIENQTITLTYSNQNYYRMVVRGSDAEAFKLAFGPINFGDSYELAFSTGIILSNRTGTQISVLSFDGVNGRVQTLTLLDENSSPESLLVINEDGSYTRSLYGENGNVTMFGEYSTDGSLLKTTAYYEDGSIEYIETNEYTERRSVTTRVDKDGNIIRSTEFLREDLNNGERTTEKVIQNNILVMHQISEQYNDGIVKHYRMEVEGDQTTLNISISRDDGYNNLYSMSKKTVNDTIIEYICSENFYDLAPGDLRSHMVSYDAERNAYIMQEEYYTDDGYWTENVTPADQYTPADWEIPTWPNLT